MTITTNSGAQSRIAPIFRSPNSHELDIAPAVFMGFASFASFSIWKVLCWFAVPLFDLRAAMLVPFAILAGHALSFLLLWIFPDLMGVDLDCPAPISTYTILATSWTFVMIPTTVVLLAGYLVHLYLM